MPPDELVTLETLLRLLERVEAAAYRWGALSADVLRPAAWEEALAILRAERMALRRAIAAGWATAAAAPTAIEPLSAHRGCDLGEHVWPVAGEPLPGVAWCIVLRCWVVDVPTLSAGSGL